ncbi:MAG: fibrobacter succinogenes major paralogous domain-containing protein [Bacteroidota bacterium]
MKKTQLILAVLTVMNVTFNFTNAQEKSTFTDVRDNKVYKTVKIGEQTWMAQNLNFSTAGSWCYDDVSARCEVYGRLYEWEVAKNACPANWHLPSDKEWTVLTDFLGGEAVAGGKLKDTTNTVWFSPNEGANNSTGFTGLPGGFRNHEGQYGDTEMQNGMYGNFWTSTDLDAEYALRRRLAYKFAAVGNADGLKKNGYSVRCVKD